MWKETEKKAKEIFYINDVLKQGVLTADSKYMYWKGHEVNSGKIEAVKYRIDRKNHKVEKWILEPEEK